MQKRGQVSVFAIVGIVAVAAIIFIFLLLRGVEERAKSVTDTEQYLESQIEDIKGEVEKCIGDVSSEILDDLYESGGHLEPVRYADYYGKHVAVLCYKVEDDEQCYNQMFTKAEIIEQILPVLEAEIPDCAESKLNAFEGKDYEIDVGDFSLNEDEVVFDENALLVSINYPITLTKDNFDETEENFVIGVSTNFWQAAEIAREIVNLHAIGEEVDVAGLSSGNIYFEIGRTSYLNGNVYFVKERYGEGRIFYFAVET